MMNKFRVLWCDRNIYTCSMTQMLDVVPNVEVVPCSHIEDAMRELENSSFSLIISGNLFENDMNGFDFYESLNLAGKETQFLLLTGESVAPDHPCLILHNFTFARKDLIGPREFKLLIEDLLSKAHESEDIHLRLREVRQYLQLNETDFGAIVGCTPEKVLKYEQDKDVPAHYVVKVCNRLDFSISYFSGISFELFQSRLIEIKLLQHRKVQA